MELFIFLASLFSFLALGVPICIVLLICALILMFHSDMWDPMMIATSMIDSADNYPLMAIPFFVFAGEIMTAGGLSLRVVKMAQLMIGHVRGGLGYAAIVASIIFAGLMGSSVAEAAADTGAADAPGPEDSSDDVAGTSSRTPACDGDESRHRGRHEPN